ncbi:hypothetical protein cypCar_00035932 [Cyprinus carpio]|nr:hypothetical protein cypCar_00035932 [Cyprinus carpio]
MNGLHLSEMTETARGMILNFVYLVKRYGFVSNGGWVYYEQRSQPPLLPLMVESFYEVTRDRDFLRQVLPAVETEYSFWMQNCSFAVSMSGLTHILNQYNVPVRQLINTVCFKNIVRYLYLCICRPESYSDDVELAEGLLALSICWPPSTGFWVMKRRHFLLELKLLKVYCGMQKKEPGLNETQHLSFYPSNMALLWAQCYSKLKMADQGYAVPDRAPVTLQTLNYKLIMSVTDLL